MTLHFIRPWWLLALVPVVYLVILLFKRSSTENSWLKHCDKHLLEHIMVGSASSKAKNILIPFSFLIMWLLAILALAGPSWKYEKVPTYQKDELRVIALDVSQSMDTADVSPTRLERAKLKIVDMLRKINEGQVGMVVFSSEPFVVSPLTSDANTIESLVSVLNTGIVPVHGHNIAKAIKKSAELIQQIGAEKGQIILVTDSTPSNEAISEAKKVAQQGIKVDVYAIGTPKGGIAKDTKGNYVKDQQGNIQYFGVDLNKLQTLARAGGGELVTLSANNNDIKKILLNIKSNGSKKSKQAAANTFWQDDGIYFVWVIAILSAFLFRRGILERVCR